MFNIYSDWEKYHNVEISTPLSQETIIIIRPFDKSKKVITFSVNTREIMKRGLKRTVNKLLKGGSYENKSTV